LQRVGHADHHDLACVPRSRGTEADAQAAVLQHLRDGGAAAHGTVDAERTEGRSGNRAIEVDLCLGIRRAIARVQRRIDRDDRELRRGGGRRGHDEGEDESHGISEFSVSLWSAATGTAGSNDVSVPRSDGSRCDPSDRFPLTASAETQPS